MRERFIARLLSKRQVTPDGHWIWTGTLHPNGYAQTSINYQNYWVHRLSAHVYLKLELDDKKQHACHKRECLRRDCFNPAHLYVGNARTNCDDKMAMGRHVSGQAKKTHCSNGHPLIPENVYLHINKQGVKRRDCRECNREKDRKNYPELKMARALLVA